MEKYNLIPIPNDVGETADTARKKREAILRVLEGTDRYEKNLVTDVYEIRARVAKIDFNANWLSWYIFALALLEHACRELDKTRVIEDELDAALDKYRRRDNGLG